MQIRLKKILLLLNEDWKRGRGEVFYKINFFLGKREKKKGKKEKKVQNLKNDRTNSSHGDTIILIVVIIIVRGRFVVYS